MTSFNNDSLKSELSSEFIRRNDLVNRWGNLISTYMALPGLRFFAPMSVVGASGQAVDLALGNDLSNTATSQFSHDNLAPYCRYNGSTQYHSISDTAAHDIIGNEAYLSTIGSNGLTIGMWAYTLNQAGSVTKMFVKGTATGNARAYFLSQESTNTFRFGVSSNGTNQFVANSSDSFGVNTWYFLVGRFVPSTEVRLWVGSAGGLSNFVDTTSIPATLNNSATGLAIGAQADGTQFSNIRASMCFVCCQAIDDYFVFSLFEQGRAIFGS